MREWLSGGVSPCQGEGRGFESRLALSIQRDVCKDVSLFLSKRSSQELRDFSYERVAMRGLNINASEMYYFAAVFTIDYGREI